MSKNVYNEVFEVLSEAAKPVSEATTKYRTAPDIRVELPYRQGGDIVIEFSSGKIKAHADQVWPEETDEDWKKRKAAIAVAEDLVKKAFEKALEDIAKVLSKKGIKT